MDGFSWWYWYVVNTSAFFHLLTDTVMLCIPDYSSLSVQRPVNCLCLWSKIRKKMVLCSHCTFAGEKLVTLHRPMGSDSLEHETCVGELGQWGSQEDNLLAHPWRTWWDSRGQNQGPIQILREVNNFSLYVGARILSLISIILQQSVFYYGKTITCIVGALPTLNWSSKGVEILMKTFFSCRISQVLS